MTIDAIVTVEDAGEAFSIGHAKESILRARTEKAVITVKRTTEDIKNACNLWESFLENVQIVASIIEAIGDVRHLSVCLQKAA